MKTTCGWRVSISISNPPPHRGIKQSAMQIEIGTRFFKQVAKNKVVECEIIDIVQRISTKTGELIGVEYWARSDSYAPGLAFEVALSTINKRRARPV